MKQTLGISLEERQLISLETFENKMFDLVSQINPLAKTENLEEHTKDFEVFVCLWIMKQFNQNNVLILSSILEFITGKELMGSAKGLHYLYQTLTTEQFMALGKIISELQERK